MSETNEKLSPEREELIAFRTEKLIRRHKADSVLYWTVLVMTLFAFASAVYSLVKCIFGSEEMLETYLNQILMCALALVCLNIPHFFRRRLKVRVPDFISVIVYVFVFLHFVLGEIYRFYDHYMLFDKALHTTGGAIIAFIGFSVVLSFTRLESRKVKLSPFFLVVFAFCFSLSIEYIWELVEYAVDSITYRVAGFAGAANMQRWKDGVEWSEELGAYVAVNVRGSGLKDSMTDMIVNIAGALVVCGAALVGLRLRPDWFEGKRLISYKKIPEYVRSNVAGMNEEEFSEAYAAMEAERAAAAAKELKRRSKDKKE